jgi:membrane protein DedA with SNARE-associated domain
MIDINLDLLADLGVLAYLLVFALAAFDAVFPVLPSESVVILGAVLASQGRLNVVPLIVGAAVGAICGDHLAYALGRWTNRGGRLRRPTGKAARVQMWVAQQLAVRGPSILLVARFLPGGRTASTFMSGRLKLPLSRFSAIICLAGPIWAGFGGALGYLGGATFHDRTLLAMGLGIVVGVSLAVLAELVLTRRGILRLPPAELAMADDDDVAA